MKPPICKFETRYTEAVEKDGRRVYEVQAVPLQCGCSHTYLDFQEKLTRFNQSLRLVYDLHPDMGSLGYWLIVREDPVPFRTLAYRDFDRGQDVYVTSLRTVMTKILTLEWRVERIVKNAKRQMSFPRQPGDWVFQEIAGWKRGQFSFDNGRFVEAELKRQVRERDVRKNKKNEQHFDDVADEFKDVYDSDGNLRRSVLVEKPWEKVA